MPLCPVGESLRSKNPLLSSASFAEGRGFELLQHPEDDERNHLERGVAERAGVERVEARAILGNHLLDLRTPGLHLVRARPWRLGSWHCRWQPCPCADTQTS